MKKKIPMLWLVNLIRTTVIWDTSPDRFARVIVVPEELGDPLAVEDLQYQRLGLRKAKIKAG